MARPSTQPRLLQARYDAALELIRASDDLRVLAGLGRATDTDRRRRSDADQRWNTIRQVRS